MTGQWQNTMAEAMAGASWPGVSEVSVKGPRSVPAARWLLWESSGVRLADIPEAPQEP